MFLFFLLSIKTLNSYAVTVLLSSEDVNHILYEVFYMHNKAIKTTQLFALRIYGPSPL